MSINVLSLFDGCSGGRQALERIGIKVNQYYASEIDKYAIKVTQANYPNTIQLGSVVDVDVSKLPKIDLLLGGSPCQSFSFAGKRKGMSTKCETEILTLNQYLELKKEGFEFEGQSYLFWEYMRILSEIRKINPDVKFLLENVEMGEKWEKVLSKAIGVNGVHINSALVSAQNRKRIYWCNFGIPTTDLFGEVSYSIPQPDDKGILLKDILETEVEPKYYLNSASIQKMLNRIKVDLSNENQTKIIDVYNRNIKHDLKCGTLTDPKHGNFVLNEVVKIDKNGNIKDNQDKASTFTAGGNLGGNHSDMDLIIKTSEIASIMLNRSENWGNPETNSGKHYTLCKNEPHGIKYDNKIRRLTPIECERLQTVKDNYTKHVSDSQRYKMLGNGWTIDVICHILKFLSR